jgi:AcrR family transcriptional regulator
VSSATRRGRGRPRGRDADASRRELLDAAAAEFAARGYRGATVDGIARRAGLSKGTFYWVFGSKDDVFRALLEERIDRPVRAIADLIAVAGGPGTGAAAGDVLGGLLRTDRDVVLLVHEYWIAAARDRRTARRFADRQRALRDALARAFEVRHEADGVQLAIPAEDLAEAFIALALGLSMDALVDRASVSPGLFGEIASLIYDGMVHRAR